MSCLRFVWITLALLWAIPGTSSAAPPEIPVPAQYLLWTVTTGGGSGIVVGLVPQEVGGKIAVCGAIWPVNEKQQGIASRDRVFRETIIEFRGKLVRANLNALPVVANQEAAKTFRCLVTTRPWEGPYKDKEFTVRLRTSTIRD